MGNETIHVPFLYRKSTSPLERSVGLDLGDEDLPDGLDVGSPTALPLLSADAALSGSVDVAHYFRDGFQLPDRLEDQPGWFLLDAYPGWHHVRYCDTFAARFRVRTPQTPPALNGLLEADCRT